jgi:hypothetical protein
MASTFLPVRSHVVAVLAAACALAGCSGSGGTASVVAPNPVSSGSPIPGATPTPSPSASPTPVPSATPTASPTPSPGPTVAPSSSCTLEGPVTDLGPGPNGTYSVSVAVGPGSQQGVSLTNLRVRFAFVNTSFVSATTPTAPTTFDSTTLTWTIGSLPSGGTAQYTIVLTFTQLPAQFIGGTTFMQVHEQTTADQCQSSDVDAFQTNR